MDSERLEGRLGLLEMRFLQSITPCLAQALGRQNDFSELRVPRVIMDDGAIRVAFDLDSRFAKPRREISILPLVKASSIIPLHPAGDFGLHNAKTAGHINVR